VLPHCITLSALTNTFGRNCESNLFRSFQIRRLSLFLKSLERKNAVAPKFPLDNKCPVMINRRPCGLPIVRTGILGDLDLYECPKGHRTTLAAKKKRPKSKTKITARLRKWTTPKLTASTRKRQGKDTLNMIVPRIVNGARRKSIGKKFGQIREEKNHKH
jgi:hypothetical protein